MRELLRFTKWHKSKKTGKPISRCMDMRRFVVPQDSREDAVVYRFRCVKCGWTFPYEKGYVTSVKAPIEVRLHVMAHNPGRSWAPTKWGTPNVRGKECPKCGFDLVGWKPIVTQEAK